MATTTNYSWTTPDDTDLVKDGAAAIRSLGTAIDTTVFNNAGAAISKTIVDSKGDIIAATAADTVARLAVGANDTVLTADSSTATGLKWAAPAAAAFVGCKLTNTVQTIPNNTSTILTFTTEDFDTNTFHDNVTNTSRITIPAGKGGYYLVLGTGYWATNATGTARYLELLKNGSLIFYNNAETQGSTEPSNFISQIVNLVATDYLELRVIHTRGSDLNYNDIQFQVSYLGA